MKLLIFKLGFLIGLLTLGLDGEGGRSNGLQKNILTDFGVVARKVLIVFYQKGFNFLSNNESKSRSNFSKQIYSKRRLVFQISHITKAVKLPTFFEVGQTFKGFIGAIASWTCLSRVLVAL